MKTTIKNLKSGLTICFLAMFCFTVSAQDLITLKNGEEHNGKVIEVTETDIKYKKAESPDGPTRVVSKTEVFSILYQNGTKDVFNKDTKGSTVAKEIVPVYINNPQPNPFEPDSSDFAKVKRKRFGGPRIGLTYIAPGTSADYLASEGKQPLITQFGWQFEGRLFTVENDLSGLIEFIPLIGGVEQGLFIPSASLLIGLRGGKNGAEFAMGPNFSVIPDYLGNREASVGIVVAAGMSLNRGNINFPINLAFIPSVGSKETVRAEDGTETKQTFQTGWRLSLVVGFNLRKK